MRASINFTIKDPGHLQVNPQVRVNAVVPEARKVSNKLIIGEKEFDGSEQVEITAEDLGAITEIPVASEDTLGAILTGYVTPEGSDNRPVKVDEEGNAYVTIPSNQELIESTKANSKAIINLQNDVNDLEDSLETNVTDLNNNIQNAEQTLNSRINTEVETLNTRITTEVETLNTTINNAKTELNETISTTKQELTQTISDTETRLEEKKLDKVGGELAKDFSLKAPKIDLEAEELTLKHKFLKVIEDVEPTLESLYLDVYTYVPSTSGIVTFNIGEQTLTGYRQSKKYSITNIKGEDIQTANLLQLGSSTNQHVIINNVPFNSTLRLKYISSSSSKVGITIEYTDANTNQIKTATSPKVAPNKENNVYDAIVEFSDIIIKKGSTIELAGSSSSLSLLDVQFDPVISEPTEPVKTETVYNIVGLDKDGNVIIDASKGTNTLIKLLGNAVLNDKRVLTIDDLTSLINNAPENLNTLQELANAINNDPQFAVTINNLLSKKADLDSDGKILSNQLPSYVDDVIERPTKADFPITGESDKIYVSLNDNLTYRWSGTQYIEISKSLALGETASTAYMGSKGKKNAEDIATNKQAISEAQSNINSLTQSLNTTNIQVDKNKEDIAYTQDYVELVEETVNANKNNINSIWSTFNSYATKEELSSTEDYIAEVNVEFDNRISAVESRATDLETRATNLETAVSEAEEYILAVEDAKLDKVAITSSVNQVYGKNVDGSQSMYDVDIYFRANAIVQRDTNSTFMVGEPTRAEHPATKNYVDSKINEIEQRSDVVDIVNDYAALTAYDTSKITENDLVKVLKDETHNNAITYYRYNADTTWTYIGEIGPYYTTSEVDSKINEELASLDSKKLNKTGDTITGSEITIVAGLPHINGVAIPANQMAIGKNGIAITNPAIPNDAGWIRVLGTNERDTVLEIAVGDDASTGKEQNEEIVVRQYNTKNEIVKEAKLLDKEGNSSVPGNLTTNNINLRNNSDDIYRNSIGVFGTLLNKADLVDGKVPTSQLPNFSTLTLGETATTAYSGDKGKQNADDIAAIKQQLTTINETLESTNTVTEPLQNAMTTVDDGQVESANYIILDGGNANG